MAVAPSLGIEVALIAGILEAVSLQGFPRLGTLQEPLAIVLFSLMTLSASHGNDGIVALCRLLLRVLHSSFTEPALCGQKFSLAFCTLLSQSPMLLEQFRRSDFAGFQLLAEAARENQIPLASLNFSV